ncbi:MAG: hypothetical protein WC054_01050 [Candidatus Nanopelagicales bacterium]
MKQFRLLVVSGLVAASLSVFAPLAAAAPAVGPDSAGCVTATVRVVAQAQVVVDASDKLADADTALAGLQTQVLLKQDVLAKAGDAYASAVAAKASVAVLLDLQTKLTKAQGDFVAAVTAFINAASTTPLTELKKVLADAQAKLNLLIDDKLKACAPAPPTTVTVTPTTTAPPLTTVTVVPGGSDVVVVPNDAPETGDGSTE